MSSLHDIKEKILDSERVSEAESLILFRDGDLYDLGFLADFIRKKKHPDPIVTYVIDRNINYTDICISACKFCAFYKAPEDPEGTVISFEELAEKIAETQQLRGTQILLQGGLHPDKPLEFYLKMLRFIKKTGIHIHGFSPPEICHFSKLSGLSVADVIKQLKEAGLDSIPGGGAEILSDRVRCEAAPRKCSADEWIEVMRQAHHQGMRTTATIPWPFQPDNTAFTEIPKASAHSYLKMLAWSRIVLDNIDNIQASWVTQGPKIAQVSLFFGANDFGSTMIEENVVAAAGVSFRLSEKEIRNIVEGAGFVPQQRTMDYTFVTSE